MRVQVVAVGKLKELRDAADDYASRIKRYCTFEEHELKDAEAKEIEERFKRATQPRAHLIAMEVTGKSFSSEAFSKLLDGRHPSITFLIGGSYGLPPNISQAANATISLSAMTLPHRLARVVLFEQIYRGFTILRNEPYSH